MRRPHREDRSSPWRSNEHTTRTVHERRPPWTDERTQPQKMSSGDHHEARENPDPWVKAGKPIGTSAPVSILIL